MVGLLNLYVETFSRRGNKGAHTSSPALPRFACLLTLCFLFSSQYGAGFVALGAFAHFTSFTSTTKDSKPTKTGRKFPNIIFRVIPLPASPSTLVPDIKQLRVPGIQLQD